MEAEGRFHNEKDIVEYDQHRTKISDESGITVLRFTNQEIIESITSVIIKIEECVNALNQK